MPIKSPISLMSGLFLLPLTTIAMDDGYIELRGVAGYSHMSVEESQLELTPTRTDKLKESSESAFQGGLGAMYAFPLLCDECNDDDISWFPEAKIGVMGYGLAHTVSGDQLDYSEASLPSEYDLDIDNFRLMADASLTVASWEDWSAFVLGGIGASWSWVEYKNQSGNTLPITIDEHLTTTFAWEVGAGLGYDITEQLSISIQYLFTDFGNLKTGDDASNRAGSFEVQPAEFKLRTNSAFLGLEWAL